MTRAPVVSSIDRVGLALVALFTGWVGFVGLVSGRSPRGAISLILLVTAAYALGRGATRFVAPWVIPAAVVLLGYAVFLDSPRGALSPLSAHGFLGYANAKAAFFVQAAFATAIIAASARSPAVTVLSLPAIALFVSIPIHARSLGGFLASFLLIPALLAGLLARGRRAAIVLAAAVAFGGIATSLVLAREFAADRDAVVRGQLAERVDRGRAAVWADAYQLLRRHPGLGVGPGGFAANSPTAAREPDLGWAHNEFLQQGAETGLVGLALLVALLGWLLWRLWVAGTAPAAVAALAVSALVLHSCAEYLFHFPLLPAMAAALAGSATAPRSRGT